MSGTAGDGEARAAALSTAPECQPAAPACGGGCSPAPGTPPGLGRWALRGDRDRSARTDRGNSPRAGLQTRIRAQPLLPAGSRCLPGAGTWRCRGMRRAASLAPRSGRVPLTAREECDRHHAPRAGQRLQRGSLARPSPADSASSGRQRAPAPALTGAVAPHSPEGAPRCHQQLLAPRSSPQPTRDRSRSQSCRDPEPPGHAAQPHREVRAGKMGSQPALAASSVLSSPS